MPFAPNNLKCVFRGVIRQPVSPFGEVEEFAHQITVALRDPGAEPDWDALTVDVAGSVAAEWIRLWQTAAPGNPLAARTWFSPAIKYLEMRCYRQNAAGLTENLVSVPLGAMSDATGDIGIPPQCALAVSLYAYPLGSFNPDGRHGRGRFYLPPMSRTQLDHFGVLSDSAHLRFSNWMASFITSVASLDLQSTESALDVVIPGSDGINRVVERVRMGRVIDTQRRRRGDINENYIDSVVEVP